MQREIIGEMKRDLKYKRNENIRINKKENEENY